MWGILRMNIIWSLSLPYKPEYGPQVFLSNGDKKNMQKFER